MRSGKLHAILSRPYTKGRDIYDLMWYLLDEDWPKPNFDFLNKALLQIHWKGPKVNSENWLQVILRKAEELSWKQVVDDVEHFLERPSDAAMLTLENLRELFRRRSS